MKMGTIGAAVLAIAFIVAAPSAALAADCAKTSVGLTALPDLAGSTYNGVPGGLYPNGSNDPPAAYATAGAHAAAAIVTRNAQGAPDGGGAVALLSIGMSNTTMEYSAFVQLAKSDPLRDQHVVTVDGAQGGQDAKVWADPNANVWSVVEDRLRAAKVTDAQVQAIWLKQAQARPTSTFDGYTRSLASQMRAIVDIAAKRYPNLRQVFVSPRTYAGYATTDLNPEPYAYWSGFADRLLVGESVARPEATPWIGWGPYLWTDGTRGRGDGFTWTCADVRASDGTHPSDTSGRQKVAQELIKFFDRSPFTTWYRGATPTATTEDPVSQHDATPASAAPMSADQAPPSGLDAKLVAALAAIALFVGVTALLLYRAR